MEGEPGPAGRETDQLVAIFSDANKHIEIAEIIRKHLEGKEDVREIALEGIDLSGVISALDLGCGYGFFTESLAGKVHPDAMVTGIDRHEQYLEHYRQACIRADLRCSFTAEGADILTEMADNIFDLVICSYALYFFPNYIRYIARVLKKEGIFVAITHSRPHMKELTTLVKDLLKEKFTENEGILPYGELISQFSNENGMEMLRPWFGNIRQVDYKNTLKFGKEDFEDFEKYFRFKRDFFISPEYGDGDLTSWLLEKIREKAEEGPLSITKDDMIFICSDPRKVL